MAKQKPTADSSLTVAEAHARAVADEATLVGKLFPAEMTPLSADALAALQWETERFAPSEHGTRLAELHGRCIVSWPALAHAIRTLGRRDVGPVAAAQSRAVLRPEADLAAEALERFDLAIAGQLAAVAGHPLAAVAAEFLEVNLRRVALAADLARQEAQIAADRARIEAERLAAERAAKRKADEEEALRAAEADLARLHKDTAGVLEDERARLLAMHRLRGRLNTTPVQQIRGARFLYNCRELAIALEGRPLGELEGYAAALDQAEAEIGLAR